MVRKALINIGVLLASVIFTLCVIEAGLRIYGYLGDNRYPTEFDAELGWTPKPNVQPQHNTWGTTMTTLEDGTRSNGSRPVQNGTEPILAVGDSFTWGDHVSDWETWPAQLEQLSRRKVVNGGVPGYGVDQIFLRLKRLLGRNHYSTVIFSFIPGDIERGQRSVMFDQARPYFDLKDDRLTLENVPLSPLSPKESGPLSAFEESRVVQALMKRAFPNWWESRHGPSELQVLDDQRGSQVACALFRELEALSKSQASDLIILFQHYDEEALAKRVKSENALSCLSDPATRVLDLRPALLELKDKDLSKYKRLYIPGDGHMTPEGNDFVAHEIIKFLDQRGNAG